METRGLKREISNRMKPDRRLENRIRSVVRKDKEQEKGKDLQVGSESWPMKKALCGC